MKNKDETLLKSEVKAELVRSIKLWLEKSEEKKQKKEQCSFGSWQRNACWDESQNYFSMAHALFFVGQDLGLLTYADYPMFRPADMEKEG